MVYTLGSSKCALVDDGKLRWTTYVGPQLSGDYLGQGRIGVLVPSGFGLVQWAAVRTTENLKQIIWVTHGWCGLLTLLKFLFHASNKIQLISFLIRQTFTKLAYLTTLPDPVATLIIMWTQLSSGSFQGSSNSDTIGNTGIELASDGPIGRQVNQDLMQGILQVAHALPDLLHAGMHCSILDPWGLWLHGRSTSRMTLGLGQQCFGRWLGCWVDRHLLTPFLGLQALDLQLDVPDHLSMLEASALLVVLEEPSDPVEGRAPCILPQTSCHCEPFRKRPSPSSGLPGSDDPRPSSLWTAWTLEDAAASRPSCQLLMTSNLRRLRVSEWPAKLYQTAGMVLTSPCVLWLMKRIQHRGVSPVDWTWIDGWSYHRSGLDTLACEHVEPLVSMWMLGIVWNWSESIALSTFSWLSCAKVSAIWCWSEDMGCTFNHMFMSIKYKPLSDSFNGISVWCFGRTNLWQPVSTIAPRARKSVFEMRNGVAPGTIAIFSRRPHMGTTIACSDLNVPWFPKRNTTSQAQRLMRLRTLGWTFCKKLETYLLPTTVLVAPVSGIPHASWDAKMLQPRFDAWMALSSSARPPLEYGLLLSPGRRTANLNEPNLLYKARMDSGHLLQGYSAGAGHWAWTPDRPHLQSCPHETFPLLP